MSLRHFEEGQYLLSANAREAIKKVIDRIARLEVVEERLHWDASPGKDWGGAQDFWGDGDWELHGQRLPRTCGCRNCEA